MGGEDALSIDPEDWPAVREHVDELLDIAETEGAAAAGAWLTARGWRWSWARPATGQSGDVDEPGSGAAR